MKRLFSVFVLTIASSLFMQSCMKCDHDMVRPRPQVTTQAITASVTENTKYSYTLTTIATGSMSYVTTAAAHGTSSIVVDANGNLIYTYTPTQNYTGTDVAVVTTSDAGSSGCFGNNNPGVGNNNPGGHGCNHPAGHAIVTTINFTVNAATIQAANKASGTTKTVYY